MAWQACAKSDAKEVLKANAELLPQSTAEAQVQGKTVVNDNGIAKEMVEEEEDGDECPKEQTKEQLDKCLDVQEEESQEKCHKEEAENEAAQKHPKDLAEDLLGKHSEELAEDAADKYSEELAEVLTEKGYVQLAKVAADKCPDELEQMVCKHPEETAEEAVSNCSVELAEKVADKCPKDLELAENEIVNNCLEELGDEMVDRHEEPAGDVKGKLPEELAKETVLAEEVVNKHPEEPAKGVADKHHDELMLAKEVVNKQPEEMAKGVVDKISEELAKGVVDKLSEELAKRVLDKVSEKLAKGVVDKLSEELAKGVVDKLTEKLAKGVVDKVAEDLANGVADKYLVELQLAEEVVNQHPDELAKGAADKHHEELRLLDEVVNVKVEKLPKRVVDKRPEELQLAEAANKQEEELANRVVDKQLEELELEGVADKYHEELKLAVEVVNDKVEEPPKGIVNKHPEELAEEVADKHHNEVAKGVADECPEVVQLAEEVANKHHAELKLAEEVVDKYPEELPKVVVDKLPEELAKGMADKQLEELKRAEVVNKQVEELSKGVEDKQHEEVQLAEEVANTQDEELSKRVADNHHEEVQLAEEVVYKYHEELVDDVADKCPVEQSEAVLKHTDELAKVVEDKHPEEQEAGNYPERQAEETLEVHPVEVEVTSTVVNKCHEELPEGVVHKEPEEQEEEDKSLEQMACVKIDAEDFSIIEKPSSATTLVAKQRDHLLASINLHILVQDLVHVGNCVRIAYSGVVGCTELQIKVREIGYDVTRLCNRSATTVSKFKQASGSILEDLQGTYQFLLDGMENIALVTLSEVNELAKDMASAAKELHKEFEEESLKVEGALQKIMMEKGTEEKMAQELEECNRKYKADKNRAEEQRKVSEQELAKCEQQHLEAEMKQEKAYSSAKSPVKALVTAFTAPVGFKVEVDEQKASECREEKLQHLDDMRKQRELRRKAIQDIAEIAKRMKDCTDNSELATVAIDALQQAMGGLQKLALVMLKIATFWEQFQAHCEMLNKSKTKNMVKAAMETPKRERLEVWTARCFKKQAITYYAQWVALDDVCAVYMVKIKETQTALYGYLTENPTVEEARANVHQLAVTFGEDLKKAQDAMDQTDADDELEKARILKAEGTAVY